MSSNGLFDAMGPGAFERPFPTACQRIREGPLAFKITPSLASRPHHDATNPAKPGPQPVVTVKDSKPPDSSTRETLA